MAEGLQGAGLPLFFKAKSKGRKERFSCVFRHFAVSYTMSKFV